MKAKVYQFMADGFEDVEALIPVDVLPGDCIAIRVNGDRIYEAFGTCDAETLQECFQLLPMKTITTSPRS